MSREPVPAKGYKEALSRIEALNEKDAAENKAWGLHPLAHTRWLSHGRKTERAIALLHGYTTCPQQFEPLGQAFYELGYNVLIPRVPLHGIKDRLNGQHANLTCDTLTSLTDEVVDILRGAGRHITVAGLSMGGNMAAWAAQTRPDVDLAVLIAPAIGYNPIPAQMTRAVVAAVRRLPNFFIWYDPRVKEALPPEYGYPRFSTHAVCEIVTLGERVRDLAVQEKARAGEILVITSAADIAVNNRVAEKLTQAWKEQGKQNLYTYEFPAEWKLPHDLIDPNQPDQQTEQVYPVLLNLITGQV